MKRLSLSYSTLREVRRLVCSASLSRHLACVVDSPERADFYRSEARAFLVQARSVVTAASKGVSNVLSGISCDLPRCSLPSGLLHRPAVDQQGMPLTYGDESLSASSAPSRLRLLCLLVKDRGCQSKALPVHALRSMPPRPSVSGRWALPRDCGLVLLETLAREPSAKVVVRCLRQREANAFRANPRTVRTGGVMA